VYWKKFNVNKEIMNKLRIAPLGLIMLLFACQSNQQDTKEQDNLNADTANMDTVFHGIDGEVNNGVIVRECYLEVDGRDSLKLNIEIDEQLSVTGKLDFANYQMDSSSGEVSGKIIGDTLVLVHEYQAEGTLNKVERVFLKQNDQYFLGKGETEEVDGVYVYPDRSEISFENTRVLDRIECNILD